MIGMNGSRFGQTTGFVRRYPGGSENRHIFATVSRLKPKPRATSRRLFPSTNTKYLTAAETSTAYIHG